MKITKNQLKQIIKEELSAILGEEELNEFGANPLNPDFDSPHYGSDKHKSDLLKQSKCKEAKRRYLPLEKEHYEQMRGMSAMADRLARGALEKMFEIEREYPDCFPRRMSPEEAEEEKKRAAQE